MFITVVLSKVSERLMSARFDTIFGTQWCVSNHSVCLSERSAWVPVHSGQEARIVQIEFSVAFCKVNHRGILNKLCFVGIGSSVFGQIDHSTLWWTVVRVKW